MDIKSAHPEEVSGGIFSGENGKDYRTMGRRDTLFALITAQLGLGIRSLLACLKVLGLIPGISTILGVATLTWYTGLELHQFFCRHHYVINVVEMIKVVGGRSWGIVTGIGFLIQVMVTCALLRLLSQLPLIPSAIVLFALLGLSALDTLAAGYSAFPEQSNLCLRAAYLALSVSLPQLLS
ncbi:hypothetical protein EDB80DRAFT_893263 [Ilyonectria destructans]|nr:hypothetical protein EDB80DRAFT_893263 [Ilyonectria destructans]